MTLEHALTVFFTWFIYLNVALLIGAILVGNLYAALHAWRSERYVWFVVIVTLFLAGGGIATPLYLVLFHAEPMPGRGSEFWRRVLA